MPPPGQGEAGSGDPGADLPESPRAVPEGRRQVPRSDPERHLELHRPAQSVALGSRQGDQRASAGRRHRSQTEADDQGRPAVARLRAGCATTAPRSAATGSTADRGPRPGRMMQRRGTEDPSGLGIYPNWGWSWPANRRVLYNRASCDPSGKPWDPDAAAGLVERGAATLGGHRRARLQGRLAAQGSHGAVHHELRRAWGGSSCRSPAWPTGPFPEHYEPIESPVDESAASRPIQQSGGQAIPLRHWTNSARPRKATTSSAPPTGSPSTTTTGRRTIR